MSRPKPPTAQHSLPVAGVLAGLSALGAGLLAVFVMVMVVWLLAAHGQDNTGAVIRASGSAWLAMHLVPVTIGGNPLGLLPMGVLAVPLVLARRSMRWAVESARPEGGVDNALLVGYATMTYATCALFISMYSSTSDVMTVDATAVWHAMVIFGVVASAVVFRRTEAAVPTWLSNAIRPGVAAGLALYAAGAVLTVVALTLHFEQVNAVGGLMAPNLIDGVFLTALGVSYVPTAVAWAMSYGLGVAVHVGTGVVSMHSSSPGRLPAFPLLAMLQTEVPRWAVALLAVPVTVGALTALALPRNHWRPDSSSVAEGVVTVVRLRELRDVAIATLAACAVTGGFALMASGPLGRDQLATMGPIPLDVVSATAQWLGGSMLAMVVAPRVLLVLLGALSHRQGRGR